MRLHSLPITQSAELRQLEKAARARRLQVTEGLIPGISDEAVVELIRQTLAIEGINVSVRLTRAVVGGAAVAESDRRGAQEISNILAALRFAVGLTDEKRSLNAITVREFHTLVGLGTVRGAGSFREGDVRITGSAHTPPAAGDVPGLVTDACEAWSGPADLLLKAAWIHWAIAAIHPFFDGNGRTARIVQDFTLMHSGLPAVGVPGDRGLYYGLLESCDGGDFLPLATAIGKSAAGIA